ncbi:FemAB family PEP-CTERM system-associated protein [Paraglaciecola aquimarina]|uniref:FemAB family PEP-CTERM system-associated protein n=1 Tax=Paraglaciecola algarum TaxID=3050085 RepID=A0ABS9D489_9ALTE|nr:FemAB family XrtA/PEP-CTERM system-associated protein [Paraglaciecola sp. G1-23]MCF2947744.1 FemAB family PEP-CTERM system-associated protein [Paraglaciecola sp. G1-23]
MKYKIVQASHQLETDWDTYVESHKYATPYHRFAWLKSVEQAYQHNNVSLLAYDQDEVVGVLPCIKMQRPLAKSKYCSLPFCDLGYGLADNDDILKALQAQAKQSLDNIGGNIFEYRDSQQDFTDSCAPGAKVRMLLPLPDTAEELMASFKSKLRSQVRKSEKNGLTFTIANNQKQINDFYNIFSINMRKLGSPVHAKQWFESLFKNYADNIFLSVVYTGDIAIGAGVIIRNKYSMAIPWASTVADYNKLAPNMMLYWSLLKHSCDLGCKEFDFGRSSFGEGTFKFKQQWGAKAKALSWSNLMSLQASPSIQDEDENQAQTSSGKIRPLVENIWAKLPLGVTTTLGPKIRRHISL